MYDLIAIDRQVNVCNVFDSNKTFIERTIASKQAVRPVRPRMVWTAT